MSFLESVKETAASALNGGKRQAKRAQLEVKNRQVERRINKEYAQIGRTLYPLLSGGELSTNNAQVEAAVKAVTELQKDVAQRQGEIERVLRPEVETGTEMEQKAES
jgi:hypothetical protein